ncbi:MAG: radical SAM protein [Caulobacterales bacterium]|uniref:radical SAM protein n=1 Tax=Glycocaulis sp. TaxID=1969725 RepID=UPI003FA082D2
MTQILAASRPAPFTDPDMTAKGEVRASVAFDRLKTLWVMTGTLCNIACINCYIESAPDNDRLVYIMPEELEPYLDEVDGLVSGPIEIGFTGGEPFLNPRMAELAEIALKRGHRVLILTNAMRPMMRPRVQDALLDLQKRFAGQMTLRVSLDHYTAAIHDAERGEGGFAATLEGLGWLSANRFSIALAGRQMTGEPAEAARDGYARLIAAQGWDVDADNPAEMVIFPEMDPEGSPPEITTACWDILKKDPAGIMCASSRMIIKRRGADHPAVVACTLLPYDPQFELARTLKDSLEPVKLNHKFCAQFCVLGGASCSA